MRDYLRSIKKALWDEDISIEITEEGSESERTEIDEFFDEEDLFEEILTSITVKRMKQ